MNIRKFNKLILLFLFSVVLVGCQQMKGANKPFKHNTPLIKENIKIGNNCIIGSNIFLNKNLNSKTIYY